MFSLSLSLTEETMLCLHCRRGCRVCKQACAAAGGVSELLLIRFLLASRLALLTAAAPINGGDTRLMRPIKTLLAAASVITRQSSEPV